MQFLFGTCISYMDKNMDESIIIQSNQFSMQKSKSTYQTSAYKQEKSYRPMINPQMDMNLNVNMEVCSQQSLIDNLAQSKLSTSRILQQQWDKSNQIVCQDDLQTYCTDQKWSPKPKHMQATRIFRQPENSSSRNIRNIQCVAGRSINDISRFLFNRR